MNAFPRCLLDIRTFRALLPTNLRPSWTAVPCANAAGLAETPEHSSELHSIL